MNKRWQYWVILMVGILSACTTTPEQPVILVEKAEPVQSVEQNVQKTIQPTSTTLPPDIRGFRQQTSATWYHMIEHGNLTASGDIYDYYAMTAAHQTLPMGSQVQVRHTATGHRIIVMINDRQTSPMIKLSTHAAKQLGIWGQTNSQVLIEGLYVKRAN